MGLKGASVLIWAGMRGPFCGGTGASVWENHYGTVMELKSRSTLIKKTQTKQALNWRGPGSYLQAFSGAYLIRDAAEGGTSCMRDTVVRGVLSRTDPSH